MDLTKPQIIQLPKINDPRGNLSFVENGDKLPFDIKRTFWTYDVPGGEIRGGHAYQKQEEFIIALSGSFDVIVKVNGIEERFCLNRSYYGLYIPALTWRHMENFSTNALSVHLSSELFNKNDYILDYNEYASIQSK